MNCVFCPIPENIRIIQEWMPQAREIPYTRVVMFEPLNPVVPGHVLVVPRVHYPDAGWALLTSRVMGYVAEIVKDIPQCNVITSKGKAATQTVFHFHVHIVPRSEGDDLSLPWDVSQRLPGLYPKVGW